MGKSLNFNNISKHRNYNKFQLNESTIFYNDGISIDNSNKNTLNINQLTPGSRAYIIGGKDVTTHGELPRSVERYLIAYCSWKILKRDSSVDSSEAQLELAAIAQEIINSYALISDDVQFIPKLNSWDDWSLS